MVTTNLGSYDTEVDQGWNQEISSGGTINAKNLQKIVVHLLMGD